MHVLRKLEQQGKNSTIPCHLHSWERAKEANNYIKTINLPKWRNKHLNTLEEQLLSPVLLFMKIATLHKTKQHAVHGPVICVPSDVKNTAQVLPRPLDESCLINVKLKWKLNYKGHHLFQKVRPHKLHHALEHLKTVHPSFNGMHTSIIMFCSKIYIYINIYIHQSELGILSIHIQEPYPDLQSYICIDHVIVLYIMFIITFLLKFCSGLITFSSTV